MAVRRFNPEMAYGVGDSLIPLAPLPIVARRNPTASDLAQLGTTWVNESTGAVWILARILANASDWVTSPVIGGAGVFTSLQVTTGSLTVDAGAGGIDVGAGAFTVDNSGNVVANDLTVSGVFTFTGDLNLTSAALIDLTSTLNAAPSISLTANGGANEQILLHSVQGTSASSIELVSDVGGVLIEGGLNTINAVKLQSTNAAGGVNVAAGTAGITLAAVNGAIALTSGTGAINIGADAVAHAIALGNSTGVTSIALNTGSGASLNLGTNAIAHTVTIGNITGATAVNVNTGTGGFNVVTTGTGDVVMASADTMLLDSAGVLELNSSAGVIGIGNDAVAQNINIGTGAAARVITIGNVSGASQVVLNSGSAGVAINTTGAGDFVVTSADTVLIDSAGVLELNSSAGVIGIGNDAVAQNINVGTGAAARVITVGNASGATSVVVNAGTGAASFGANATDHSTNLGSATGVAATTIQGGTAGITMSAPFVALPGPVYIYTGAGAPGNGLALHVGDMYINTTAASAVTRLYIATAASTWTNVTCAA